MQKITPFLWYAKEAEEAATFYASLFPDSRVTQMSAKSSLLCRPTISPRAQDPDCIATIARSLAGDSPTT